MEPIEYVRALVRRWPIIAVCALIGAVFAFLSTDAEPEPVQSSYTATNTLIVSSDDANQFNQQTVGTVRLSQVPIFATRGEVPRRAAEQLQYGGNAASLAAEVVVEADEANGTLTFTSEQENPDDAVAIANAFADHTVLYLGERQDELQRSRENAALAEVNRLEKELNALDTQLLAEINEEQAQREEGDPIAEGRATTRAEREAVSIEYSTALQTYRALGRLGGSDLNLTTLERAQPVQQQTGGFTPPRTRSTRVPLAAGIGALFGVAIALMVERLDARLRDRRKSEDAFGAAVVGEIPSLNRKQRAARLVVGPDQHHPATEAFRSLRTSLTFMAAGGQPLASDDHVGVILITSPSPAEGKTTIAVNLSAAFAETGRSVLAVNADFRRPALSDALTAGDRAPLPAGLAGIDRLDPADWLAPTEIPGVQLLDLSSLSGSPGDLTRATVRLVNALSERFDVVIVDTPPLAVTTEALEFVPGSKVMVLVGRMGRTAATSATRAGELARFGGVDQLAVVITDTGSHRLGRSGYYGYYGGKRRVTDSAFGGSPPDEWAEVDALVSESGRSEDTAVRSDLSSEP